MTFLVNQCRVVYQNGSRFENDEPTFQIHQLPGVGRSHRYGVWAGELRDVFQGERTTPPFYPIYRRRWPADECENGNRQSDSDRSPRPARSAW
jgi:hypothetical protein